MYNVSDLNTYKSKEIFKMKNSYPIILTPGANGYVVFIPDFNSGSQGNNITEAIEMARDAIGILGIDLEDDGIEIPMPSDLKSIRAKENEILTLVDVDFAEYRRQNDMRMVRRNVTLPSWLDAAAEKSGINVSAILQKALKEELHMTGPKS